MTRLVSPARRCVIGATMLLALAVIGGAALALPRGGGIFSNANVMLYGSDPSSCVLYGNGQCVAR